MGCSYMSKWKEGYHFTWFQSPGNHSLCFLEEIRDYALTSEMWFQIFSNAKLLLHIVIIPSSLMFIPL